MLLAFDVLRDHVHEVFYMIPGLIRGAHQIQ